MASTYDATFVSKPDGGDVPSTIDNEMRNTRTAVEERMANEHDTYVADGTAGNYLKDWVHKEGSAMAYYEAAEPTNQPNGEALAARDAGRLWVDSDTNILKVWPGAAAFEDLNVGGILEDGGTVVKTKVIAMGNWDMDATASITVAHGLTLADIRTVTAMIRNDADDTYYPLTLGYIAAVTIDGYIQKVGAANVTLLRGGGGTFDAATFNTAVYNRGWVTITYED